METKLNSQHAAPSSPDRSDTSSFRTVVMLESSTEMWDFAPEVLDIDTASMTKSRSDVPVVPLPPVRWTWLTWSIEALFEYCRIAWDVRPGYQVNEVLQVAVYGINGAADPLTIAPVVASDAEPGLKTPRLRNLRQKMLSFTTSRGAASGVRLGDGSALGKIGQKLRLLESEELLCAPLHSEPLDTISENRPFFIRLLLITSEADRQKIAEMIRKCLVEQNVAYLARYEVAVVILGAEQKLEVVSEKSIAGEDIFITWYSAKAGMDVVEALKLCVSADLKLSRTTVTDIPMKEDAKTGGSQSFSFNVDLFHPYLTDPKAGKGKLTGNSLRMKWCRPVKGALSNYTPMLNTLPLRATPSDQTTRPTQCLVGYVMDGNAVILESQETTGMACKLFLCGGKICLQQLKPGNDRLMDDVPALAELPGGRVGTYRVKETVALASAFALDQKSFPLGKAVEERQRSMTSYYPLVYSETILYLLPQLLPVCAAFTAQSAKEVNWTAAREAILEVIDMGRHIEQLPVPGSHMLLQHVGSSHRKSETYAVLWAELDMFLEANSSRSPEYNSLRSFLVASLKLPTREDLKTMIRERAKTHLYRGAVSVEVDNTVATIATRKRKARPDFEGRIKYGRYGKLYQNLQKPEKGERENTLIHASLEL